MKTGWNKFSNMNWNSGPGGEEDESLHAQQCNDCCNSPEKYYSLSYTFQAKPVAACLCMPVWLRNAMKCPYP